MGVFRQLGDPVCPVCLCEHHGAAYAAQNPVTFGPSWDLAHDIINNNTTVVSQQITLTERCCVVVNTALLTTDGFSATHFEIERPQGTIRTIEENTVVSGTMHLHYHATREVLDPGTHTYFFMNRTGVDAWVYGAWLKIIASDCEA